MALADILNALLLTGGQNGPSNMGDTLPPGGSVPGFAGGHFGGAGRGPTEEWRSPQISGGVDLNAALARNAQIGQQRQQRQQRPPGTPGKFMNTLGMIGDALATWRGGQPHYSMRLKQQQAEARQQAVNSALANYLDDPESAIRAVLAIDAPTGIELAKLQPRAEIEQVGNTIGWVDPRKRSFDPIYSAPQPFETYARSLGLEPGTPEYAEAIREYRAGTWNDEGVEGRLRVQQPRLEVTRENNIRTTDTSRANTILRNQQSDANSRRSAATQQRGQDIRAKVKGRPVGGKPVGADEPMARDAQGRPMVVRNGKWVVVQ